MAFYGCRLLCKKAEIENNPECQDKALGCGGWRASTSLLYRLLTRLISGQGSGLQIKDQHREAEEAAVTK